MCRSCIKLLFYLRNTSYRSVPRQSSTMSLFCEGKIACHARSSCANIGAQFIHLRVLLYSRRNSETGFEMKRWKSTPWHSCDHEGARYVATSGAMQGDDSYIRRIVGAGIARQEKSNEPGGLLCSRRVLWGCLRRHNRRPPAKNVRPSKTEKERGRRRRGAWFIAGHLTVFAKLSHHAVPLESRIFSSRCFQLLSRRPARRPPPSLPPPPSTDSPSSLRVATNRARSHGATPATLALSLAISQLPVLRIRATDASGSPNRRRGERAQMCALSRRSVNLSRAYCFIRHV